jgi:protein gp37/ParB-like chromosome segregation protein Spo0J
MTAAPGTEPPFHPVANIFPLMGEADLDELAADIRANGQRELIWRHRDGRIVDGRNRWLACRKLGIEPATRTFGKEDAELVRFVVSLNLHRRHLSESQRAMVATRIASLRQGRPTAEAKAANLPVSEAAKLLNVSERSVRYARRVAERGTPELIAAVDRGEVPVSRAAQTAAAAAPRPAPVRKRELHEVVSLEQWKALSPDERQRLLSPDSAWGATGFNRQEGDSIGWAQWSWNPISGCLHDCIYCYARDIATLGPTSSGFPHGFQPTLYPRRLLAPSYTKPRDASTDWRERNVFTGSMTDLWGRWVPKEWIEAVLAACRAAPEWTFLFLTKFPQRMAEFDLPDNGWYGTTVDLQARVAVAEKAFAKVRTRSPGTKTWLSVEPMLEPLKFKRLDLFDWIVIGGASRSSKTPEWKPPFEWIVDLHGQARAAGCRVWHKENLLGSRVREMMDGLPVPQDPQEAPEVFRYLGRQAMRPAA